ncbi:MAG: hypothetical protein [Wendovervirus sonii]|uniref:Uncharacterized protein n=1 Tax=phage Lak_Megaphage_Sonny TaxID=3109229 RepID=A0ABZ0Z6G1_9CAUD|nr:MAG: hypothetical protein [phage Lak_Megaphage_Sonny]
MSIKIKVKKHINENKNAKWNGWDAIFEEDANQNQQQQNTDQNQQNDNQQSTDQNQQNQQQQSTDQNQQNNNQQSTDQNQQNASTNQPAVDVNKFVTEVQNFYIGLSTYLKGACDPKKMKEALPTYVTLKETEPYKGKEQAFANAVNELTKIDEKDYQKIMPGFSKIIEELGKYVSAVAQLTASGEKAQPVTQQPAPAQTQGQPVTTTTTAPTANTQQQSNQ